MAAIEGVTAHDPRAQEVLTFWFGGNPERGKARKFWFAKDPAFDTEVRERFSELYEETPGMRTAAWKKYPTDCLALVIVLDQFPRHMFRGTARAFATDPLAIDAARHAIERRYDAGLLPVEKLFLYLPFEHSESLDDQWRALALVGPLAAWPETANVCSYAVRHWEIVRRFGRFPHRNAMLGRPSTAEEIEFLKRPGSGF
jgi:uncharacterized protein (DUF924 family)